MNPIEAILSFAAPILAAQNLLSLLLIAIGADFVLGTLGAMRQGHLNSSTGKQGSIEKAAIVVGVLVFMSFDPMISTITSIPIAPGLLTFFIAHELQSIVENLARCGVKLPPFLLSALEKARDAQEGWDQKREATATAEHLVIKDADDLRDLLAEMKQTHPEIFSTLAKTAATLDAPSLDAPSPDEPIKIRRVRKPRGTESA